MGNKYFVLIIISFLLLNSCGGPSKPSHEEALKINIKLEALEDQIRLDIQNGDQAKALELVNQLVHPMHQKKLDTKSRVQIQGVGLVKYYYDEYWTERRNKYREQILAMPISGKTAASDVRKADLTKPAGNENDKQVNPANLPGSWNGPFGENQITFVIKSIDDHQVTGYDIVQGKTRNLLGKVDENNTFTLNEPGDEEWDGVFTFKIDSSKVKGNWRANNGKMTIDFNLKKTE